MSPYNNPTPSQSTTLTTAERAKEACRILNMLREESKDDLEAKLTPKAESFIESKWLEMDFGGKLETITIDQYFYLQDIWSRFV